MKYRLTLVVEVSLTGSCEDLSGFVAKTIQARLSEGRGGRYAFPGEVVANTAYAQSKSTDRRLELEEAAGAYLARRAA